MAIGFDDEFDYLDDENFDNIADAPFMNIKGSNIDSGEREAEEKKAAEEEKQKVLEEVKKIEEDNATRDKEYESVIFVVKVTTNKEDKAMEMIVDKVLKRKVDVYALARPHGVRGYVFLESPDREHAEEAVYNLPYVKGILPTKVKYSEIRQMLEPVASEIKIEKNDIVEIIGEAFKNEKAKVVRVDKQKGDAVVSLLGAAVPIPVNVKLDNIRVIRREELED